MAKRRPSGDGMVRKRPDGRWEGRIVVGHKENGASIFRYVSAGSQKELTDKLRRSIEDYRVVELTEDSRMTLSEWLDRWLEEYAAPTVRPSTLAGYRQYIDGYIKPRLGEKRISKVMAEDVRKLYRELQKEGRLVEHPDYGRKLSGSTIRNIHGVLHEAMDTAVREGLTARNIPGCPCSDGSGAHNQIPFNLQWFILFFLEFFRHLPELIFKHILLFLRKLSRSTSIVFWFLAFASQQGTQKAKQHIFHPTSDFALYSAVNSI